MSFLSIPQPIANFAARFLANRNQTMLLHRILEHAKKTPYSTIYGKDGSVYMERYWIIAPSSRLRWLLPLMRMHIIHSADSDRDPHDHPWSFTSLILRGSYWENRWTAKPEEARRSYRGRYHRTAGSCYRMDLGEFHRITDIDSQDAYIKTPVTTLCILNRRQETWGFLLADGRKRDWRSYFGLPSDAAEGSQPAEKGA